MQVRKLETNGCSVSTVNVKLMLEFSPTASVTRTLNVVVPAAVGVPLSTPWFK
jgi:hypothetical protein